jgi:alanine dehydrogenase
VLILTRSKIASLLNIADVIEAVEAAHAALASGRAADLGPVSLAAPASSTLLIPMTAALASGAAGVKLLMDRPGNAGSGGPAQQSTIVLTDADSGSCVALLDGAGITAARTAAASAVATKHLSRPDSTVLGFVGAGTLARTHLAAIRAVRPVREVLIWSRTSQTARAFAAYAAEQGVTARIAAEPDAVLASCDIVCTLTPSREPLVRGRSFRPGLHVNAVGAPPRPDHREIDSEGIRRSRVIVDSRAVALRKSGDVLIPLAEGVISETHVHDELGQVIIGARPGRTSPGQVTLYNSTGLGIQDIATAQLIVAAARAKGMGEEIMLDS